MNTKSLMLMVLFACTSCGLGAVPTMPAPYDAVAASHTYVDLVSPTPLALGDDALSALITPSGFVFRFYGVDYTSIRVGSNGYILFGGAGTASPSPDHAGHGLAVSPFWTDLDPTQSAQAAIGWHYEQGKLIVEWRNVPCKGAGGSGVRMQLVLIRDMSIMECRYGLPDGLSGATSTAPQCVAISKAPGAGSVFAGKDAGYIATDGSVSAYPAGRYLRFQPSMVYLGNPVILAPGPVPAGMSYPAGPAFPLPPGTHGVEYRLQFSAVGGVPPYYWAAASVTGGPSTLPAGWSLSQDGLLLGPAAAVVAGQYTNIVLELRDSSINTQDPADLLNVTIDPPALAITSAPTLPAGNENQPYAFQFAASGGIAPLNWSSTNLPAGFALSAAGDLSIPASAAIAGTWAFDITVTDSSAAGQQANQNASLTIVPPGTPLSITSAATLPAGIEGVAYAFNCTAVGGQLPYIWSAAGVPGGWSISNGGSVTAPATQVAAGTFSFTVTVTDTLFAMVRMTVGVQIDPAPAIVILTSVLADAVQGLPYSQAVIGTGGTGQGYSWSVASGALPPGIGFVISGNTLTLAGTALQAGAYSFSLEFADSQGHTSTRDFTLQVASPGIQAGDAGGSSGCTATGARHVAWLLLFTLMPLAIGVRRFAQRRSSSKRV